ncbi:MAG: cell division protein FtsQ/DivIB [Alysiella sp.]|uniref:cell division protein FtsQ/DivIB n=1 Tax=Alysiella sp. TaxID=1872483 RepID=UPI0026DAC64D|nr:cell division protein FtsQ/DivIB [Alysiella sp.]MDO4434423.1 cell division protein FtsQ/DivIB [Alysiella sp.]
MKKWFYLSLLAWVLTGIYWLGNSNYFRIAHLDIQAAESGAFKRADPVKIFEAVRTPLTGNFFHVDLQAAKNAALTQEWVSDVQIDRIAPATIKIHVHEYEPVARWLREGWQAGLWDNQGRVFQAVTDERLPEMDGDFADRLLMLEQYQLFATRLKPLRLGIERLQYTPRGAWTIMLENGIEVRLGKDDVYARLSRFVDMWSHGLAEQAAVLDYVDMRYPNAVAIKRRNGAAETVNDATKLPETK